MTKTRNDNVHRLAVTQRTGGMFSVISCFPCIQTNRMLPSHKQFTHHWKLHLTIRNVPHWLDQCLSLREFERKSVTREVYFLRLSALWTRSFTRVCSHKQISKANASQCRLQQKPDTTQKFLFSIQSVLSTKVRN